MGTEKKQPGEIVIKVEEEKKAGNEGRIASHQGTFVTSKGGSSFQQDQGVQLLAQKKQHFLKWIKGESFTLNQDSITFHFNTK